ncbi:MAG: class I adenylate-forming enzyme family protein [Flavobacteriaceae bacterium]
MLVYEILDHKSHAANDRPAIVFHGLERTFGQLRTRSCQLANALLALAEPGDRVAVLSYNSLEYAEAYYGIPRAGMTMVVINYRLTPAEMASVLSSVSPCVLIVEPDFLDVVDYLRATVGSVRHILITGATAAGGYEDLVGNASAHPPAIVPSVDDVAWLLFTSGTTGLPKSAMLTHRNIVAGVVNSSLCWGTGQYKSLLLPWPMYHIAGYAMLEMHLHGNTVHLLRKFDREEFLTQIQERRITDITLAPTMISMLLEADAKDIDLSSIEHVYYGSAPMPLTTLREAMKRLPGARFRCGYGMTEAAGLVMYLSDTDHELAARTGDPLLGSVGRAMPLTAIKVVDGQGKEVPTGEVGEILIKGDQVITAIWQGGDIPPQPVPGGWFATGDLGRFDDRGYMYIVDRSKDMIISGGENIFSKEIEDILYQLPEVAQAAVFGVPDEYWGENVVAALRLKPGSQLTRDAVLAHCRIHLAGYKKPKLILFVDEMPLNPSGKILKRVLREWVSTENFDDLQQSQSGHGT